MKGLLIKDFKLMKTQKNFFFVIIAISIFLAVSSEDTTFTIGFLGFVGTLFTLSSISYDEFDNGYPFLFTLPVTRTSYVLEKYSFGLLVGGVSWIFGTAISMIASLIKDSLPVADIMMIALIMLPVLVLLLSIMLPFQLKFGGEKGRIAIIGAVGILAVIGVFIVKIAELFNVDLVGLFNNLPAISMGMLVAIAVAVALIIMLLSMKISVSIMNKKEL